jgi:hypothetical protein
LAGDQAAELLTECRRKHWHCALHQIDTGGTFASITIQSSIGLHKVRDVCDVHSNVISAIFVDLEGYRIIKILCSFRINCEYAFAAQILAYFELAFRNAINSLSDIVRVDIA